MDPVGVPMSDPIYVRRMDDDRQAPARSAPASPQSKLELAYQTIRQRILDGTYSAGYRLVLDQLARELAISTVPVREAVRRLEAEGYIEFQRNVGARVATLDAEEYVHTMHVLALLEGYATAIAAPRITKRDLARIRKMNDLMRDALGQFDPVAFTRLNKDFHFAIYERCPNDHVRALIATEWARLDMIRRSSFIYVPGRAHGSVDEHDVLLDLIESGAGHQSIEQAARDHKLHTVDALLSERPPANRRTARPKQPPTQR